MLSYAQSIRKYTRTDMNTHNLSRNTAIDYDQLLEEDVWDRTHTTI